MHPMFRRRRGFGFVYVVLMMTVVFGLSSLAVEFGYVQVAKTQLQNVADAAARAGMSGLATSPTAAQNNAISVAAQNTVNASTYTLTTADIDLGTWNSGPKTLTVLTGAAQSSATAVRINAHATIPLVFGKIVGMNSVSIHAVSVATTPAQNYGIVGITSISMSSTGVYDSYDSSAGVYSVGSAHSLAKAASNGNITLAAGSTAKGDTHPGVGKTSSGGTVTGSRTALGTNMSFASVAAGSYATTNDNASIAYAMTNGSVIISFSGPASFPGGVYYLKDLSLSGGCTITGTGTAALYVYGNCTLNNCNLNAYQQRPTNFRIYLLPGATLTLQNTSSINADIYCPDSAVSLSSASTLYGRIIAASITQTGTGGIHQDESLPQGLGSNLVTLAK